MANLLRRSAGNRERTTRRAMLRYSLGGIALAVALAACANSASRVQPRAGGGSSAPTSTAPVTATATFGSPPTSAVPSSPSIPASAPPAATGATNTQGPGYSQPTVTPTPSNGTVTLTNADADGYRNAYVAVPVGTLIEVRFDAFSPPPATIAAPQTLDSSILQRISSSGEQTRHSQAVFRATAVGQTAVVATEYDACKGACANPGLAILIAVVH